MRLTNNSGNILFKIPDQLEFISVIKSMCYKFKNLQEKSFMFCENSVKILEKMAVALLLHFYSSK